MMEKFLKFALILKELKYLQLVQIKLQEFGQLIQEINCKFLKVFFILLNLFIFDSNLLNILNL